MQTAKQIIQYRISTTMQFALTPCIASSSLAKHSKSPSHCMQPLLTHSQVLPVHHLQRTHMHLLTFMHLRPLLVVLYLLASHQLSAAAATPATVHAVGAVSLNEQPGRKLLQCVCAMVFKPVCGSDGIVYGNACEARCAGATAGAAMPQSVRPRSKCSSSTASPASSRTASPLGKPPGPSRVANEAG